VHIDVDETEGVRLARRFYREGSSEKWKFRMTELYLNNDDPRIVKNYADLISNRNIWIRDKTESGTFFREDDGVQYFLTYIKLKQINGTDLWYEGPDNVINNNVINNVNKCNVPVYRYNQNSKEMYRVNPELDLNPELDCDTSTTGGRLKQTKPQVGYIKTTSKHTDKDGTVRCIYTKKVNGKATRFVKMKAGPGKGGAFVYKRVK
jgi:hypothetical protein